VQVLAGRRLPAVSAAQAEPLEIATAQGDVAAGAGVASKSYLGQSKPIPSMRHDHSVITRNADATVRCSAVINRGDLRLGR